MSLTTINSYSAHHRLNLKLKPILVGELHLARKLEYPVYIFRDGVFVPVINEGTVPSKDQITKLIKNSYKEVFVYESDKEQIKSNLRSALVKITRSISLGDPLENGTKGIKLLTMNLANLYSNPHDNELLTVQFQNSQNLSKFFLENKKILPIIFQNQFKGLSQNNFHFTLSQPMLSSILLLAFLQSSHLFHEKEIENLFLTSYLKDIGYSIIPESKYDLKTLSSKDKDLFANHANFSFDLLEDRIPLAKNYLEIIRNHHFLNDRIKAIALGNRHFANNDEMMMGLESTLVAVFDILVAMISERPYRRALSLYQSLEVIKRMMADEYPQEFKALVVFLKNFFKN